MSKFKGWIDGWMTIIRVFCGKYVIKKMHIIIFFYPFRLWITGIAVNIAGGAVVHPFLRYKIGLDFSLSTDHVFTK